MHWLQTLDAGLFHLINPALSNSFLDVVMPFFSGTPLFAPAIVIAAIIIGWKGGARGRVFLAMLILAIALGDSLICNTLKELIARPRPFFTLTDVHMPASIGKSGSGSMPSSHAANWFAATMVAFIYYRRSIRFMLPMALLVSFSRIYNGVHYPSDVLAGAILGAGYAAGGVWTLDAIWKWAGARWFPLWWRRMPSLMNPVILPAPAPGDAELLNQHWMRLGYTLIFAQLFANLWYIASGLITLSEDEAYQWIWSKHLAISYYSKPPLIALTQFLGTHIWGDTAFGVRFFSPVIATLTAIPLFRFVARVANIRTAFWLSVLMPLTPLLSVGCILMTIDPLSVMFWVFAMIAGWRAIQDSATTKDWLWVGLWMGLGFLSKYTALFQLLSWVAIFALYPPSRKQLRRSGPYLALLVTLLCSTPVVVWNAQHGWITVKHVSEGGRFDQPWAFTLANLWIGFKKFTLEFVAEEAGLQNPFIFLPTVFALFAFWKRRRNHTLLLYFFCMGAPLFACYFLLSFHSRVLPNWIAPSILPFFCVAVIYWEDRWHAGFRRIKPWIIGTLVYGCIAAVLLRDTALVSKLAEGHQLPAALDSTRRVKGWTETADVVEGYRQKLMAEGKPVFIICAHYGITGELTFNLPEAKATVKDHPLVYYQITKTPDNQFFFWPNYLDRKGQNAIYVQELDLAGKYLVAIPQELRDEFDSVTDLGTALVMYRGQPIRRLQISECRGLR
ncbi:MAG TPA: glycosyltransferase family 39 protein [Verrucomicrobiae bacterium]|jgi:membrane-associated phospholipid phosphatase|nr:glycosyltransferase family 39 protein [Verrucomicrobiae bacterium]